MAALARSRLAERALEHGRMADDPTHLTDAEVKARLSDLHALALTMDAEGRGDWREGGSSVEERIAIGCVIRNRVRDPRRWPRTYAAVCLQRGQFACWVQAGGLANYRRTMALARSFVLGTPRPPLSELETRLLEESLFLAAGIIGGQILDRVRGATHYYAPAAMQPPGSVPEWARNRLPLARVGAQLFFRV